jgi:DNA-binding XRE family transcriptional regulator
LRHIISQSNIYFKPDVRLITHEYFRRKDQAMAKAPVTAIGTADQIIRNPDSGVNCQRMKRIRNHLSFTQKQLAEVIGVTRESVSRWESGKYQPDRTAIFALKYYLQLKDADLV